MNDGRRLCIKPVGVKFVGVLLSLPSGAQAPHLALTRFPFPPTLRCPPVPLHLASSIIRAHISEDRRAQGGPMEGPVRSRINQGPGLWGVAGLGVGAGPEWR